GPLVSREPAMQSGTLEVAQVIARVFRGLALLSALDLVIRHARQSRLRYVKDEASAAGRGALLCQPQQQASNDEWVANCRNVHAVDRAANRRQAGRIGHVLGQHEGAEQLEPVAIPTGRCSVALPLGPHLTEWNGLIGSKIERRTPTMCSRGLRELVRHVP